ncbi:DUF421 domain-containing protein [Euzebya sp.]|uniref:DUF421 domain-containing protein n=1 Tax=Euzebya sp. TaxID=1971409 RepID=UPI0035168CD2
MSSASALSKLGITPAEAGLTVLIATAMYLVVIVLSRVFGQRQFATATSYDMAFTFALGSIVGRVVLVRTSLATAVLGLVTLFGLHATSRWLHHRVPTVHRLIQNRPILLVVDGEVLDENLRRARTSRAELFQQVRLAGVGRLADVGAVIMERSGAMSVLPADAIVEDVVLHEVYGADRLLDAGGGRQRG